jgi:hypothetical protein
MGLEDLIAMGRKKGPDKKFLDFIRRQPSAYSGRFSEYLPDGTGRCVAAHVRRASNSGTGMKPAYSAIPLTREEHDLTHQKGEQALMPKEWFDKQALRYLRMWIDS